MEEEAADHLGEALAEEGGEEHELVVQDEDEVPRLVRVGHHLVWGGGLWGVLVGRGV